jgi:hypothetical protein
MVASGSRRPPVASADATRLALFPPQGRGKAPLPGRLGRTDNGGRVIRVALDQSKVGQHIALQMEAIEADYGEDSEIGDICTIVEIRGPHGSHVRMRSTAASPHSTLGLLKLAEQVALANFGRDDG